MTITLWREKPLRPAAPHHGANKNIITAIVADMLLPLENVCFPVSVPVFFQKRARRAFARLG